MKSEGIGKLALALSKAQAKIIGAVKDSNNPFFKSKYAQLDSVMDAIREPFAENELSLTQVVDERENRLVLVTILMHSSGEYIMSVYPLVCKDMSNPQALKSLITYARRTSASAIAGVAETDDDAEEAMARTEKAQGDKYFEADQKRALEFAKQGHVTEAQFKRLYAIQKNSSISQKEVMKMIKLRFNKNSSKELTMNEYDELIKVIESNKYE
jgi:hypothetical protein